ncbi:hypothetical protein OWV82_003258 [Melia azedarach]|uniref:Uncharacterized protein n=1 Tax=Melia azedarach TaxID=155640 RepID=A0ACC1YKP1_MELAZ|nr:hypothetical protein OWV82_003258 [Melia azedarach]
MKVKKRKTAVEDTHQEVMKNLVVVIRKCMVEAGKVMAGLEIYKCMEEEEEMKKVGEETCKYLEAVMMERVAEENRKCKEAVVKLKVAVEIYKC